MDDWLVVSNMAGLFYLCSIIFLGWNNPEPIDELIVFKMVKTTNQPYING